MATITEDRYAETKDRFKSLFDIMENSMNGLTKRRLHEKRKQALHMLDEVDFPTRRDEDWKYTSVRPILQPKYQLPQWVGLEPEQIRPFRYDGLDAHLLVFVNGVYDHKLSVVGDLPGGAVILPMEEAMERDQYQPLIQEAWVNGLEGKVDPFLMLNAAFGRYGTFIHLPADTVLDRPIHLLSLALPQAEPQLISPQTMVIAERSSQATILESFHAIPGSAEAPYFTNQLNRFVLRENATLRHFKVQRESDASFLINNTIVDQYRDSTYSSFVADLGGSIVRNNVSALLKSSGTLTNFYGIFLGDGRQHVDNQSYIDHAHPHCQSNELYKGILTDRARGVFNGKVMVRQDAQKTNAFQQNATLVLSDKAQMDSKPQLEIFADDVRCSHGATIGQLDEDAVFYLRSRGLSDHQARALLQHAFIKEVIDFLPSEVVREQVDDWVVEKFSSQWS